MILRENSAASMCNGNTTSFCKFVDFGAGSNNHASTADRQSRIESFGTLYEPLQSKLPIRAVICITGGYARTIDSVLN